MFLLPSSPLFPLTGKSGLNRGERLALAHGIRGAWSKILSAGYRLGHVFSGCQLDWLRFQIAHDIGHLLL